MVLPMKMLNAATPIFRLTEFNIYPTFSYLRDQSGTYTEFEWAQPVARSRKRAANSIREAREEGVGRKGTGSKPKPRGFPLCDVPMRLGACPLSADGPTGLVVVRRKRGQAPCGTVSRGFKSIQQGASPLSCSRRVMRATGAPNSNSRATPISVSRNGEPNRVDRADQPAGLHSLARRASQGTRTKQLVNNAHIGMLDEFDFARADAELEFFVVEPELMQ